MWTLCGKPMRGRQETSHWFLFYGGALITAAWGLRQKVLFGASWNRIFLFLLFWQIGWAKSRNESEISRYLAWVISLLRWVQLLALIVTKGSEDAAWIQGSIFFITGVNQGNSRFSCVTPWVEIWPLRPSASGIVWFSVCGRL